MRLNPRRLRRGVLPVCGPYGPVGTATVVAPGLALTALHVVTAVDPAALTLGCHHPVVEVESLPLAGYRGAHDEACRSVERAHRLVGPDTDMALGTVDLALLVVPGLPAAALRWPRPEQVQLGEHFVVPGYPGGHWSVNQGPVTGVDDADFAVRVLLGPGASGSPVLDRHEQLVGLVTLDHESATFCIGPVLISTFLDELLAVASPS